MILRFLSRITSSLLILIVVYAASRGIIHALPGDPIELLVAETGISLPIEELRRELGLDRPYLSSTLSELNRSLQGDWGISILSRQPIGPSLLNAITHTLGLTLAAVSLGLLIALPLGCWAARAPSSPSSIVADRICSAYGAIGAALPTPWLGPILIYGLAVRLPIFPITGHIALPALTLAIGYSGLWARLIRERVKETLIFGASRGARARGIVEWKITLKYGLAPALGALLAYLGTQIGSLLGGAFIVETLFDWPGIGSLIVESVLKRDYPLIQAGIFVAAAASLTGTWLGDALQFAVDPRQRSGAR